MTKKVNLIIVVHPDQSKVLMCERQKKPYKGKLNFVGGKLELNEKPFDAAYRELEEETGITYQEIILNRLITFDYPEDVELQVYYGLLEKDRILKPEKNPLKWIRMDDDFRNLNQFAGNGNIEYLMHILKTEKLTSI